MAPASTIASRRDRLTVPIKPGTHDRMTLIASHVGQGSVLDVGCVDARPDRDDARVRLARPNRLFEQLVRLNSNITGLDIDFEGVKQLADQGFDVHHGNAETVQLDQTFDVIVAGELIEHLENPGQFLRNMRRHLKPTGKLLLTTPNAFSARRTWKIIRRGQPNVHTDHTCWFDPITLSQLLARTGFQTTASYWIGSDKFKWSLWPRWFRAYFGQHFLMIAQPEPSHGGPNGPNAPSADTNQWEAVECAY